MVEYSKKIFVAIKSFLDTEEYNYDWDEQAACFRFNMTLPGKINRAQFTLRVYEEAFIAVAKIDVAAGQDERVAVAEFLTRANYGLREGNFEMDYRDGEIRYKDYVPCGTRAPEPEVIRGAIMIPCAMIRRYGDSLVAVLFSLESPEMAIARAERD